MSETSGNRVPMLQTPAIAVLSAEVTAFPTEKDHESTFSALPYENVASWLATLESQWSGRFDNLQWYWSLKAVMLIKGGASYYKSDLAQIPDWAKFKREVMEIFPCETTNAELEMRIVQHGYANDMDLSMAIRKLTNDYDELGDDYDIPIAARVLSRRIPPEIAMRYGIEFLTISGGREVLKKMRHAVASEAAEGRPPKWALAKKHTQQAPQLQVAANVFATTSSNNNNTATSGFQ
ncbi:hypothetical protein GQ54DRAFT_313952 [Martensiomyces pterosporus]|nr:hypothetical protein GQ54DRAFT_313952 [Martensiomyces pterosporus]